MSISFPQFRTRPSFRPHWGMCHACLAHRSATMCLLLRQSSLLKIGIGATKEKKDWERPPHPICRQLYGPRKQGGGRENYLPLLSLSLFPLWSKTKLNLTPFLLYSEIFGLTSRNKHSHHALKTVESVNKKYDHKYLNKQIMIS
jgi:hypothetical protein